MLLDIFSSIIETIGNWVASLGFVWVVLMGLGLVLLAIIVSFVCTQMSIEVKTLRATNKLNKYLELNPFVTEDNLVEFNKLMKRIPSTMRRQWQQYMVSRDKKPSEFFSEQNCVDKPFKSSAYTSHITAVRASIISIAILGFIFCTSYFSSGAANIQFSFVNILTSLMLSAVALFVGEIYLLFLKARRNSTISDVYFSFNIFQKFIDRAVTTLPEYVDYEILFTRKEITAGIPVLQEYLQQRALYEQEQIKKAKESEVVHEQYDFSALGINGSLVMERAMHVSEQFIGNKNGTRAVISELEGERDLLEKNYDEKDKTAQRKLRDIQETLDRLKEKLDSTTNLIVGNDLRKQRENEIQKQRQIEKEAQEDNRKFEEERKKINAQIEAKRAEIEEDRKRAETSLNSEFKSYADKIYAELKAIVDQQNKDQLESLTAETTKLQLELEEKDRILVEKETLRDEALEQIEGFNQKIEEQQQIIAEQEARLSEFGNVDNDRNKEIFEAKQELESRNLEIARKDEVIAKKDEIIARKDEQIENQKEYISELKRKKHISGDEVYADEDGRMYFIDDEGKKKYVNQGGESSESAEEQSPEYNEVTESDSSLSEDASSEQPTEESENLEAEPVAEETTVVPPMESEPFSAESLTELVNEQLGSKEEEEPVELADLEELKAKFHKPVYDFKWENSNSLSAVEDEEENVAPKNDVSKTKAEPNVEEKQEEQPKEDAEVKKDEIEKLDELIEEQNAKLKEQNKDLSEQLEHTKKVVEAQPKSVKPKQSKKSPAKKQASKKQVSKKPASKKQSSKKASSKKSSPKKPAAKKAPVKKATSKKPVEKVAAKEPVKKASTKSAPKASNVKSKQVTNKTLIGELNLAQFNEQLKSMLKDIETDKGE